MLSRTDLKFIPIFAFIFVPLFSFGQLVVEIGGFAGISEYQGDLAENKIELGETLLSKGLFVRFFISDIISLRTSFYNGKISGNDKNADDPSLRNRGWSFEATVNEFSVIGEINILGTTRYYSSRSFKPSFSPVIFAGIGVAHADANLHFAHPNNNGFLTVPFPEPGDTNTFFVVPVGVGLRLDASPHTTLGLELGWRAIFSDYLDGVSKNGRRTKDDWYSFVGINIAIFFGRSLY